MYVPGPFKVDDIAQIEAFLGRYDFATIVSTSAAGLIATHVPIAVRRERNRIVLVGHVARANSHWEVMDGAAESLAIAQGPHAYVSPTWYEHSPAVPTWNYAAVHAYGNPRARHDRAFIEGVVRALTTRHESGRKNPWRLDDVPSEYCDRLLSAIVGFEMPVERLEGKFKLGQNRRPGDREETIAGLRAAGDPGSAALADFMRHHLEGG